jgi:hypothetical protein
MADTTILPKVAPLPTPVVAKNEAKPATATPIETEPTTQDKKITTTLAAAAANKTGSTAQADIIKQQLMTKASTASTTIAIGTPNTKLSASFLPSSAPFDMEKFMSGFVDASLVSPSSQQKAGVNVPIPSINAEALNDPAVRNAKFEDIVKTRGAASGATAVEIQTTLDTVKANNQKVAASKPELEAINVRTRVINNDPDYVTYKSNTPERLTEREQGVIETNNFFTKNGTQPDAFWDKKKDEDLAKIAVDRQKVSEITSNPEKVSQYEALKAEEQTLSNRYIELTQPRRDNIQELVKVGVLPDPRLERFRGVSDRSGFIAPGPDPLFGRPSRDRSEYDDLDSLASRYGG